MKKLVFFVATLLFSYFLQAQVVEKQFNLQEVIDLAVDQSPQAYLAKHQFRARYWAFRSYKASFLPALDLNANLLNFNRSITVVDVAGKEEFVERNSNNSNISLSLTQNLAFSGGQIFLSSQLSRLDLFGNNELSSYSSVPIIIGFSQPLFAYNPLRWQKRIEPIKYAEAKKRYIEDMEEVKLRAVNLFFGLALAQLNVEMEKLNYSNNDTLFRIATGRYKIGTIAENDLLQIELSLLNSETSLNQAVLDLQVQQNRLRSFLGFNEKLNIQIIVPEEVPTFEVDVKRAVESALENNSQILAYKRQLIEAERDVSKARAENRFNASLYGSYGLNQTAPTLSEAYQNPENSQRLRVGISIPILDWGKKRGRYKMAQSTQEVVNLTVKQTQVDFEQDVFLKVAQFNMQAKQVSLLKKAAQIAQNRYQISLQRFYIGKVDALNLNVAIQEKDAARRTYLSVLRNYWVDYFEIRKITLFNFEKHEKLSVNYDLLVE